MTLGHTGGWWRSVWRTNSRREPKHLLQKCGEGIFLVFFQLKMIVFGASTRVLQGSRCVCVCVCVQFAAAVFPLLLYRITAVQRASLSPQCWNVRPALRPLETLSQKSTEPLSNGIALGMSQPRLANPSRPLRVDTSAWASCPPGV